MPAYAHGALWSSKLFYNPGLGKGSRIRVLPVQWHVSTDWKGVLFIHHHFLKWGILRISDEQLIFREIRFSSRMLLFWSKLTNILTMWQVKCWTSDVMTDIDSRWLWCGVWLGLSSNLWQLNEGTLSIMWILLQKFRHFFLLCLSRSV